MPLLSMACGFFVFDKFIAGNSASWELPSTSFFFSIASLWRYPIGWGALIDSQRTLLNRSNSSNRLPSYLRWTNEFLHFLFKKISFAGCETDGPGSTAFNESERRSVGTTWQTRCGLIGAEMLITNNVFIGDNYFIGWFSIASKPCYISPHLNMLI